MFHIISAISILLLIIAIPSLMPYGYYVLLRWAICGSASYMAYLSYEQKNNRFLWLFGATAILFNPIAPLYLGKEIWVVVDFLAAVLFFVALFQVKSPDIKK